VDHRHQDRVIGIADGVAVIAIPARRDRQYAAHVGRTRDLKEASVSLGKAENVAGQHEGSASRLFLGE
jgi:hypothetical protein